MARFVQWFVLLLSIVIVSQPSDAAVERVSTPGFSGGKLGPSTEPSISGTGQLVVFSTRGQLLPADKNTKSDVYLYDRQTRRLSLISDARGGDQPVISADGRFVTYRALETFPKLQFVVIGSDSTPRTISYPFNGGGGLSFRTADSAAISADGRFVSFTFRPIPGFNNNDDTQLVVHDTAADDRLNAASYSITQNFSLLTVGRSALPRSGQIAYFETSDDVDPNDSGVNQDIYVGDRSDNLRLISKSANGVPESAGACFDPVASADGRSVFYISARQLSTADQDERETIYVSTSADFFANRPDPVPIETEVTPLALSKQATSDGSYIVFLGQGSTGSARPFILNVATGEVKGLAPSGLRSGPPVISADNRFISFASAASLNPSDQNGGPDVYVVKNPFAEFKYPAPVVTVTAPEDGAEVTAGAFFNVSANASTESGPPVNYILLEVDGRFEASANSASISRSISLSTGVHQIRFVAFSAANVATASDVRTVIARPPANNLALSQLPGVSRKVRGDGTTKFETLLRIDNTFAAVRGDMQIVLTEVPGPATWEIFGDENQVPPREESILSVINVAGLEAGASVLVDAGGLVSPPERISDGFQGVGWSVIARLRELVGDTWFVRDEIQVLEVLPKLDENTPGPNGGIPQLNAGNGAPFDPALLEGLLIQSPKKLAGGNRATLRAIAVFNTGNKPCTPKWSIASGGEFAKISPLGVLTGGNVATPQPVTVRAAFGGLTATATVLINPQIPTVSVRASVKTGVEAGEPGEFRISRTGFLNKPLDVTFSVSGTADLQFGIVPLPSTIEIPAGQSSVTIPVTRVNNAQFEARKTVVLTLNALPNYRVGSAKAATVVLDDDDAVPAGFPDLIVQTKGKKPVGAFEANFDTTVQKVSARKALGKTATFFITVVNRSEAGQGYTIFGSGDFLGFSVRYFDGETDVTTDVTDGDGYITSAVEPGSSTQLTAKITPTEATPVGAIIRCPLIVFGGGFSDSGELALERSR
jgi:hypothetical protein